MTLPVSQLPISWLKSLDKNIANIEVTLEVSQLPISWLKSVDENIELYQYIDESVGITEIIFQRRDYNGAYEEIGRSDASSDVVFFLDEDVETEFQAWEYRTKYIDSCGFEGEFQTLSRSNGAGKRVGDGALGRVFQERQDFIGAGRTSDKGL